MFNDFFNFKIPIGAVGALIVIIFIIIKKMYDLFYKDFRNKLLIEQDSFSRLEIKYEKLENDYRDILKKYYTLLGKYEVNEVIVKDNSKWC